MKKKRLLFIIAICFLLTACSKEDKAKKAIKNHLAKTMHDFDSYEPVEYGTLDSTVSTVELSPDYQQKATVVALMLDSAEKVNKRRETVYETNQLSALKYSDWYDGSKYDIEE